MSLKSSLYNFIFQTFSRSYRMAEDEVPCWRTLTGLPTADGWYFGRCGIKPVICQKQDTLVNCSPIRKWGISYMSPCPHRHLPLQLAGRRICQWLLWSSRCSHAPWLCGAVACGRGGPHWGLPRQQLSGGSRESWTSLSQVMVPHPLWKNLMGGYTGMYCRKMNEQFWPNLPSL